MDLKQAAYESEVKRMRDQYGPDAEMPKSPYGQITLAATAMPMVPEMSVTDRLAMLCQQVAETGLALDIARIRQRDAAHELGLCENRFATATDELEKAMMAHRGDGRLSR